MNKYLDKYLEQLQSILPSIEFKPHVQKKYTGYKYKYSPRGSSHHWLSFGIIHEPKLEYWFNIGAVKYLDDFEPIKEILLEINESKEVFKILEKKGQYFIKAGVLLDNADNEELEKGLNQILDVAKYAIKELNGSGFLGIEKIDETEPAESIEENTIKCNACQTELEAGDKFCSNCSEKIEVTPKKNKSDIQKFKDWYFVDDSIENYEQRQKQGHDIIIKEYLKLDNNRNDHEYQKITYYYLKSLYFNRKEEEYKNETIRHTDIFPNNAELLELAIDANKYEDTFDNLKENLLEKALVQKNQKAVCKLIEKQAEENFTKEEYNQIISIIENYSIEIKDLKEVEQTRLAYVYLWSLYQTEGKESECRSKAIELLKLKNSYELESGWITIFGNIKIIRLLGLVSYFLSDKSELEHCINLVNNFNEEGKYSETLEELEDKLKKLEKPQRSVFRFEFTVKTKRNTENLLRQSFKKGKVINCVFHYITTEKELSKKDCINILESRVDPFWALKFWFGNHFTAPKIDGWEDLTVPNIGKIELIGKESDYSMNSRTEDLTWCYE